MGELLSSIFSHPSTIARPSDAPFVLGAATVVVLVTAAFMAIVGKRIMRASRLLAVLIGAAFMPAMIIAIAAVLLSTAPGGPPPNDGPAMLFMALFVMSICALPFSFATSAIYVGRCQRGKVR